MTNPATKHTDEYRLECADYAISAGEPIAQVAGEPGVNAKTLQRWVRRRRGELGGTVPTREGDAEMRALRKRAREPEMENGFLKKAGAFLAANRARWAGAA